MTHAGNCSCGPHIVVELDQADEMMMVGMIICKGLQDVKY